MGIGNWFKNILGISEDEEEEEILETQQPEESLVKDARKPEGQITTSHYGKLTVVVISPNSFDEARKAVDSLKQGRPIMANFEDTDKEVARRFIDFASGAVYALDGMVEKVGKNVFLFATRNVAVSSERLRVWEESSHNKSLDGLD
ncbi:MAG: cell division protein SepF [Caldiserica bacterium]|nr:cell division protein SepF [Caldisericota bacterium]